MNALFNALYFRHKRAEQRAPGSTMLAGRLGDVFWSRYDHEFAANLAIS